MSVNPEQTEHTILEIYAVIQTKPATIYCTKVHISHPALPITMKHLHKFQRTMYAGNQQRLSNRVTFRHHRITAIPSLTPCVDISMDNTFYDLTSRTTENVTLPHTLHLLLKPHNRMSYLQHTHKFDERTTHYLEITISLPSTRSQSTRIRRRPMMRTVTHTLDLVTMFTFPVEST